MQDMITIRPVNDYEESFNKTKGMVLIKKNYINVLKEV